MSSPEARGMHLDQASRLTLVTHDIKERVFTGLFGSEEMGDPAREMTPEDIDGLINGVIAQLGNAGLLDKEACEATSPRSSEE